MKKMEIELRGCIENSVQLHTVFEEDNICKSFSNLELENVGEKFPSDYELSVLLNELKAAAERQNTQGMSFAELMQQEHEFEMASINSWESQLELEKESLENQLNEISTYENSWQKLLSNNIKIEFTYGGANSGK